MIDCTKKKPTCPVCGVREGYGHDESRHKVHERKCTVCGVNPPGKANRFRGKICSDECLDKKGTAR